MKDTDQKTLEAMERYGGSFCNALAKAAFLADDSNMEAFQHGISTVVNALEAAEKTGLENLQTQVLYSVVADIGRGKWRPIATAPHFGTYVILGAPSGVVNTPLRCEVGYWQDNSGSSKYKSGWRTHSNDWFTDGGAEPTCWMPLPDNWKEFA